MVGVRARALLFAVLAASPFARAGEEPAAPCDASSCEPVKSPSLLQLGVRNDLSEGFGADLSHEASLSKKQSMGYMGETDATWSRQGADTAALRDWYAVKAVASNNDRTWLSHDMKQSIDLWRGAGGNQMWRITLVGGDVYTIEAARVTSTGRTFLSHNGHGLVDLWSAVGPNQHWKLSEASRKGAYIIQAAHGAGSKKYLSHNGHDKVDLWHAAGENQFWEIEGFGLDSAMNFQDPISPGECADPFVWQARDNKYNMICTGGRLQHYQGDSTTKAFKWAGWVLPDKIPSWSANDHRWAPETVTVGDDSYVFFSSPSYDEPGHPHRIGWARADGGANTAMKYWSEYADAQWFKHLHKTNGGEIDPTVYQETDDKGTTRYYYLYKSDDNHAGSKTTRLWMQEMAFHDRKPQLTGSATVLLDSKKMNLWWAGSWTPGGSLIEGPELLKEGDYYYLFFAAGRYCKPDYAEGVARSKSLWGPYEASPDPIISTGRVGQVHFEGKTPKIIGPGHAGFFKEGGTVHMVWHGSPGHNCKRHAFVSALRWEGGWPRLA